MTTVPNYNLSSKQPVLVNTSLIDKYKYLLTLETSSGSHSIGFNNIEAAKTAFIKTTTEMQVKDMNYILELHYAGLFGHFKLPRYPEYVDVQLISPRHTMLVLRKVVLGSYEAYTGE